MKDKAGAEPLLLSGLSKNTVMVASTEQHETAQLRQRFALLVPQAQMEVVGSA